MAATRKAFALLIATDTYTDRTYRQLRAPRADAEALAQVLSDPSIGGYEVRPPLHNRPSYEVELAIEDLFADARRDDLVLLYISGHGDRDQEGKLHLVATNSRHDRLNSTAVAAQFIRDRMESTRCRNIIVCLDCCYAGAFPPGALHRAGENAGVLAQLRGRGCAVMTSSTALEYSYEVGDTDGSTMTGDANPSVFTGALVKGLSSGAADRNEDGLIDVDELYEYVCDQIEDADTQQTPGLDSSIEGRLIVARSPGSPAKPRAASVRDHQEKDQEDRIPVSRLAIEIGERWRRRTWGRIPRHPIIHLVRPSTPGRLIGQLASYFGDAVPNVQLKVDRPIGADDQARLNELRGLLDEIVCLFVELDRRQHLKRFRFDRYALVSWLLSQNFPAVLRDVNPRSRDLLRQYSRLRRGNSAREGANEDDVSREKDECGLQTGSPIFLLGGRPRIGLSRRWLMGQRYLSPYTSAGFDSFVEKIISAAHGSDTEEVRRLLVAAFLEDLSEGYRKNGVLQNLIKDYYPVVLLRGLDTGTMGEELVRLVHSVRSEAPIADALLIIGTGVDALHALPQTGGFPGANEMEGLRKRWRSRTGVGWYELVRVSDVATVAPTDEDGDRSGVTVWAGNLHRSALRSVAQRYSRTLQALPVLITVVAAAALTISYGIWVSQHCSWFPWAENESIRYESGECVGIATEGALFSSGDHELDYWQRQIAESNKAAEEQPSHVTVVYLAPIASSEPDRMAAAGIIDELKGVFEAQRDAIENRVPIRVVLANAGGGMRHAAGVARDIAAMADRDRSVVAVVGFDRTSGGVKDAVNIIGGRQLPMISTASAGDMIPKISKFYRQVGPNNKRKAEAIATYLRLVDLGTRELAVYFDSRDVNSENLVADVRNEVGELGISVRGKSYQDMRHAGRELCYEKVPVLFAGTSGGLSELLYGRRAYCRDNSLIPMLLVDSELDEGPLKRVLESEYSTLPVHFISTPAGRMAPDAFRESNSLGSRGVLSFDAIRMVELAVQHVRDEGLPLDALEVWHQMNRFHGDNPFPGIGGYIDFGDDAGQVPVESSVSIERISDYRSNSELMLLCGRVNAALASDFSTRACTNGK